MVKYYYDKYNSTPIIRYNDDSTFAGTGLKNMYFTDMAKTYLFNPILNSYSIGSDLWQRNESIAKGAFGYSVDQHGQLSRGDAEKSGTVSITVSAYSSYKTPVSNTSFINGYNQGTLVQSNISAENGTYPTDGRHTDDYWYVRGALTNVAPTISLSTSDNRTLYENDSFGISGSATDSDSGNVVSVKYQLNGGTERAIVSGISTGASIPFNRALTFKGGMLFDGSNAVTPALVEGTTHSLRVWAEDDKGGKSAAQTRLFTVVANRPAALTIEPFVTAGNLIDSDTMTIKGSVADPEGNAVIVRYKIGSGSYIEILNGVGGPFSIPIKLSALKAGANAVTIQATDSYGAVSSKTLNVVKSGNVLPLKTSVTRYKINPPNGSAKGVLLWIEREVGDLIVDVEISATMAGEAESFVPMTKTSTAFVIDGIEEDEFTHDAVTPKENIVIKLTMTRASTATNNGIKLISGVLS
ncbi:Ig-like domain-containing protein [Sporosarcina psychrophila]|uniref:Bacterial Ig-like domain-containing protein n=1 Tax=Sporosarcina psychrophila TaxID=1476 RepID=A0ABV2KBT5_SPOPS